MFETIINQYKSIPNWQIGIITTILSVYIMFNAKYFADMSINIYYTIMSFYGWYVWKKGNNSEELVISKINSKDKIIGLILFIITAVVCVLI